MVLIQLFLPPEEGSLSQRQVPYLAEQLNTTEPYSYGDEIKLEYAGWGESHIHPREPSCLICFVGWLMS